MDNYSVVGPRRRSPHEGSNPVPVPEAPEISTESCSAWPPISERWRPATSADCARVAGRQADIAAEASHSHRTSIRYTDISPPTGQAHCRRSPTWSQEDAVVSPERTPMDPIGSDERRGCSGRPNRSTCDAVPVPNAGSVRDDRRSVPRQARGNGIRSSPEIPTLPHCRRTRASLKAVVL